MTTQNPISSRQRLVAAGGFAQQFQSVFGLVAILIVSAILSPIRDGHIVFLAPDNLFNIVHSASENGIIAVGMTLVILTGGIDLSVGALLALCAVGTAACLVNYGLNAPLTILLILALGAGLGLVNGLVTTKLQIQSFISTLAMMSAARGIASLWSKGDAIPLAFGTAQGEAPPLFKSLFAGQIGVGGWQIPVALLYFAGAGLLATFLLRRTGFGRHVYAVGGNETAARLSGISPDRVRIIVFVVSGLLSGLAALLDVGLVNEGGPNEGLGDELNAIAAVVIGGTSLSGGIGTILGSMLGALILSVLDNILGLRNIQSEYQMILKGVIIVLAVVIQRKRVTA